MSNSYEAMVNNLQADIPCEWKSVKFGDVARKVNITVDPKNCGLDRYVAGEHMQTDDLRIKEWGTIGDDYLGPAFNKLFKKGQILYGSRRTYLRKVAIPHFDGICANTTFVIEPHGTDLLPELLPFVMQSRAFTEHSIHESKGSTNPYVNWKDIEKYEFKVPISMERQREMAYILLATENYMSKTELFIENANRYKRVMIRDIFRNGIRHNNYKTVNRIGIIPSEWEVVNLSEISEIQYGLGQPPELDNNGTPMIRATDICRGVIALDNVIKVNSNAIPKTRNPYLNKGDIIVVRSGAYTGDLALYNLEINAIAGYDLVVSPNQKKIDPVFLSEYMLGTYVQRYFKMQSARSAQPHLNSVQLKKTLIPKPLMDEQKQIAHVLKKLNEMVSKYIDLFNVNKSLKLHLINHLLSGGTQE